MTEMIANGNMEVIDDYTFKMRLASPQVDIASWWFNILQIGCMPRFAVLRNTLPKGMPCSRTGPAGTGAYQFVSTRV